MGMAASQARFLGLTARKSNIEYEGQQINQQRTELSNQSANLYNQMLTLQVPTPPSTQDYTKVTCTFTIPGSDYSEATISQITKEADTNPQTYTISFSYSQTEMGFPPCGTSQFSTVNDYKDDTHTGSVTTSKGKTYALNYIDPDNMKDIPEHQDALDALGKKDADTGKYTVPVYWKNVGTDEKPSYQYYTGTDLAAAVAEGGNKKSEYFFAGEVTTFETSVKSTLSSNVSVDVSSS